MTMPAGTVGPPGQIIARTMALVSGDQGLLAMDQSAVTYDEDTALMAGTRA